jgi:hypothetical protein
MVSDPNPATPARPGAGQTAELTADTSAAAWDVFLEGTPLGQFQQTSRWARVKALDGWKAERVLLDAHRPDAGGLQLLWKPTRLGKIGYVSKGPVLPGEDGPTLDAILGRLHQVSRSLGLRALILQPPDHSGISGADLHRHHFGLSPVASVIRATAIIDVTGGRAAWEGRMHSKTRQQSRTAVKRGVTVRRGERRDLPVFFSLMCESCRRQNTRPNPASVEALEALWDAFSPHIMLGFAVADGESIAGLLMIGHGNRLTFWKKGWNSRGAQLYANCLLMVEALGWAHEHGYATVDFAGLDHGIAETLVAGGTLSEMQLRSRDMFNLRLGAQPQLLPPARLLVVNPVLRQLHRLISHCRPLEQTLMRRLGSG